MIKSHPRELYYATGSTAKYEMVKGYLEPKGIRITQIDLDLPEEQSLDLASVAVTKAKLAWERLGKPVIIDDVGFYLDQYNNFPGPLVRFVYEGLGISGLYKLYEQGDAAHFMIYIIYIWGDTDYKMFHGYTKGSMIKPEPFQGPLHDRMTIERLFIPEGHTSTLFSLRNNVTYQQCHFRIQAIEQLLTFLSQ